MFSTEEQEDTNKLSTDCEQMNLLYLLQRGVIISGRIGQCKKFLTFLAKKGRAYILQEK